MLIPAVCGLSCLAPGRGLSGPALSCSQLGPSVLSPRLVAHSWVRRVLNSAGFHGVGEAASDHTWWAGWEVGRSTASSPQGSPGLRESKTGWHLGVPLSLSPSDQRGDQEAKQNSRGHLGVSQSLTCPCGTKVLSFPGTGSGGTASSHRLLRVSRPEVPEL